MELSDASYVCLTNNRLVLLLLLLLLMIMIMMTMMKMTMSRKLTLCISGMQLFPSHSLLSLPLSLSVCLGVSAGDAL